MNAPLFSIIVVSLNPGEKLLETVKSIKKQKFTDYEVIVKDGGSKDGSVALLKEEMQSWTIAEGKRVRIIQEPDSSIYDGMNQACSYAKGQYFYFLNCGDYLKDENALQQMALAIADNIEKASQIVFLEEQPREALLFYGDIFDALRQQVVPSNPRIDDFACYRNVPCHQACFYHRSLFEERGYKPEYKVRADYEHFLWCHFEKKIHTQYVPVTLASYEGGGYSEIHAKRSKKEHKEITAQYMSLGKRALYRFIMIVTLQPLRTWMAQSPKLAGFYLALKKRLYKNG